MKTTIWLREARERFGGGVPSSGRSASLAVFGHDRLRRQRPRRPNSPLPAGFDGHVASTQPAEIDSRARETVRRD